MKTLAGRYCQTIVRTELSDFGKQKPYYRNIKIMFAFNLLP